MVRTASTDRVLVASHTLAQLIAQDRVGVRDSGGSVSMAFKPNDPQYPGAAVGVARHGDRGAVYRVRYILAENRYRFERIGDV
jgi:hypothetical protein